MLLLDGGRHDGAARLVASAEILEDVDVSPIFEREAVAAGHGGEVRLAQADDGHRTPASLGVTIESALGAFALHAEIALIDHGWLRLRGAGGPG